MHRGKIWNVMGSFSRIATRQVEKVQRDAYRLGRGIECDMSQSGFSTDRRSVGSASCPKSQTILLLIISVLFLSNPVLAAVSPKEPIPFSGFRFDWWLEILIISGICLLAVYSWIKTHLVPIYGGVISTILLMPIIEEYFFRYVLMYLFLLKGKANPELNQEISINVLVLVFLIVGVLFGILHLLLSWFLVESSIFTAPGGVQVGEGLFLGMLNGLIFLNFIYFFNVGLLITMVYVWTAHIMVNLVAVAYNVIVNLFFGRSFFLHLAPRLVAGIMAIVMFWYCWKYQTIVTEIF